MKGKTSSEQLRGQQYDPTDDFIVPYTEQMYGREAAETLLDTSPARTDVAPHDGNANRVRVYTAPATLATYSLSYPGTANINLPDVLESVTVTYNASRDNGDGGSIGTNASLSLSLSSKSQSSVSILPDVQVNIRQVWSSNIPVMHYVFYVTGNVTQAAVLSRLTTLAAASVSAWPVFRPVSHTITAKGQSASVSADAEVQQHSSLGNTTTLTYGIGTGFSFDLGVTIRSIRIPPTIHGPITIETPSMSDIASASASASWPGGTNWPARSAAIDAQTQTIVGSVTPFNLSATSPSSIPTSGLYLLQTNSDPWKYGYTRVYATVVDFANIG
jgi:hypothetical protein